ncbi:MAG: T9SS type A sorting domain-containing protein [Chitinophagales bacterium]
MGKKTGLFIVGLTVLLTFIVMMIVFNKQKRDESYHHYEHEYAPPPTERSLKQMEDEKMNEDREAFFALMHAAAPGTNWKKMDADLRYNKMKERAQKFSYKATDEIWDTLANGNVIGKWNELGSFNTAGRIWATEVDYENDVIYAFSDGGNLWKGDLNGENWSVINDNFKIEATNMLRKVGDRIIVSTYQWGVQGVFYTDDEGITWHETTGLENVELWGNIFDAEMLVDSNHSIYLLAYEWDYTNAWDIVSVYRSTNLGESFEKIISYDVPVYGGSNNFILWASPTEDEVCYLMENGNFNSITAADTPAYIGTVPFTDDGAVMLCGFENATAKYFYVAQYNYVSTETEFYFSDDGGLSWDFKNDIDEGIFSQNSFYCSQKTEGYLYYGALDTWRSFNSGDSWVRNNYWYEYYDNVENNMHADIPYIKTFIDPASLAEMVLISTDGGLFKSTNNGLTWTNITMDGMRNAQYYDVYTYRYLTDIMFAGAQDQGYQRSSYNDDGDYYFDQLISGDYGHFVTRNGGDNLWCVYPGFAMNIYDAAAGSELYFWDFQGTGHLWMAPIMQDPWNDDIAWWGGGSDAGGAYLWKLERSGGDITGIKQAKNFGVAGGNQISAIAYSPIDNNYWYLLTSGGRFYYSFNAGETWTMTSDFTGPGPQYFYGATIEPSKSELGVVYIGGSGYSNPGVYMSSDYGASFQPLDVDLPLTLIYDLAVSPDDSLLFAATEIAPYVYVKSENKWYDLSAEDAPIQKYWSVDYVEEIKAVRFGTYGRGAWEFKLYEEPVGADPALSEENNSMIIFPNPATDIINIQINSFIPDAIIDIIDMNGNIVIQKHAGINKEIPYRIKLNSIPSGTYFIRVNYKQKRNNSYVEKFIKD